MSKSRRTAIVCGIVLSVCATVLVHLIVRPNRSYDDYFAQSAIGFACVVAIFTSAAFMIRAERRSRFRKRQ
jgi:hypothetical protein